MTRIARLYARVIAGPRASLPFRDFERLLAAAGFVHDRTVGSHRQYVHSRIPRPFPVQPDGKDAKRYQVREFLGMVQDYGLSIADD